MITYGIKAASHIHLKFRPCNYNLQTCTPSPSLYILLHFSLKLGMIMTASMYVHSLKDERETHHQLYTLQVQWYQIIMVR